MSLTQTTRLTSKDIRVEYTPCGTAPATHDEDLVFGTNITGGTFRLRFNGEQTANITFDETVQGTTATNMQSALNGLPNLNGGTFTVTGSDTDSDSEDDTFRVQFSQDGWVRIQVENLSDLTVSSGEAEVLHDVTVQGTETFVVSNEFTQFAYERTVDTVDVTAISEYEGTDIPVKATMSFDATIYDANEAFTAYVLEEGQNGLFVVYKEGKLIGKEHFSFVGLIETLGTDFPDHEKIEISMSGMRQGDMIIPFGSIYRG